MIDYIALDEELYLAPPQDGDEDQYAVYLNDKTLYNNTLMIPHPYSKSDAEFFINLTRQNRDRYGRWIDWTIRSHANKKLIGGISFHGKSIPKKPGEEIGYWIAEPLRGQGIMTRVLKRFVQFAMDDYGFVRIEAPVYVHNIGSQRVLEKCGFTEEGYLRKAYFKDGVYIDAKLYAIVR